MNDSLDTWLEKQPRWYAVPFYEGLAKAREQASRECADRGDLAQAAKCQEAASYYAERARTIGAFLKDRAA